MADQELADGLSSMTSASDMAFVLDALDPGQAIGILGLMAPEAAANALRAMSPERLKKVLNRAAPEVIAPIIDEAWSSRQAAMLTAMDPELAASVLPRLKSPWYAFQGFEPQYAIIVLSLLSSDDVGRVLALSPGRSISPDPLDTVLDYLQPDQVEDYLSRISPTRALKLLAARARTGPIDSSINWNRRRPPASLTRWRARPQRPGSSGRTRTESPSSWRRRVPSPRPRHCNSWISSGWTCSWVGCVPSRPSCSGSPCPVGPTRQDRFGRRVVGQVRKGYADHADGSAGILGDAALGGLVLAVDALGVDARFCGGVIRGRAGRARCASQGA